MKKPASSHVINIDPPCRFGQYQLYLLLAKGGMGQVYLAKDLNNPQSESWIALKVLSPDLSNKIKFVEMFQSEGQLGLMLQHPNIVKTQALGEAGPFHFIAMDFIDGIPLTQLINRFNEHRAPIPLSAALYITQSILNALHYAHTIRDKEGRPLALINRDISPANIMLDFKGSVSLIDFGIAQARINNRGEIGSIKGKVIYMSPEQVRGLALDARSDLFSIGTVLYELLTGSVPFRAPTEFEQMERVREAEATHVSEINPRIEQSLSNFVARAMMKRPEERFQSAMDMQSELKSYCNQAVIKADRSVLVEIMESEFSIVKSRFQQKIRSKEALIQSLGNSPGKKLTNYENLDPTLPVRPAGLGPIRQAKLVWFLVLISLILLVIMTGLK
jgi:serine/threonine-protein kinase